MAHPGWQDESQLTADRFFVEQHFLDDRIGRTFSSVGQSGRDVQAAEQVSLAGCHVGVDETAELGQAAGVEHADRNGLAVEQLAVPGQRFERVAECVAVVEDGSHAGSLVFVLLDDTRFQLAAARDDLPQHGRVARVDCLGVLFEKRKEFRVENDTVFNDLSQARAIVAIGQRREHAGVDEHAERLVKRADQVLRRGMIDANLATDRTVDVGQQRRRHLEERDPASVR